MGKASGGSQPSLARQASGVAGARVAVLVVGVLASVIIARVLGPAGRGEYAFLITVSGVIFALAHVSVEHAQVFLFSKGVNTRNLAANAVALGVGLGIVGVLAVTLLSASVSWPVSGFRTDLAWVMVLAAVPANLVVLYANGLVTLEGRTDLLNRSVVLAAALQCGALGLLAATGDLTVTTVVAVWLLSALIPLTVSMPFLRPRVSSFSWRIAREEIALGLRYHPGMASFYLLLRVDILVLAALRSEREVGLYALAVSLAELTNLATDSVATAVMRRQATSSLDEAARLTTRLISVTLALATVAVVGLVSCAPFVVPLVFGDQFRAAVPAVLALAPGVLALAAGRCTGAFLVRLNRPLLYSGIAGSAFVLNLLLNFVLVPRLGIVGAGIASSIAYAFLALSLLVWLRRATRLPWSAYRVSPRTLLGRSN